MNVLFITHCTPMDGGNHSLLQLMVELKSAPYNITPILLTPLEIKTSSSSILQEATKHGIRCISSRFYPFKYTSQSPLNYIKLGSNIFNVPAILHKLKGMDINLVHSNSSIFDIGAIIAKKLHIPHIWHFREFGDIDFKLYPLAGYFTQSKIYNQASSIIAISNSVKTHFLPVINDTQIDVIYNGIPINHNALISSHKNDVIKFCITGALNSAKRQTDAIEAVNILVNQMHYTKLRLFILGEGKDRSKIENMISAYGLSEYVSLLGWVRNPGNLYSEMDCGLMLSTNEAFGRVTIEYMRASLLVIASDGGANSELINDGVTGMLFNTGNIMQLAEKMAYAIDHHDTMVKIAQEGFKFSQTNFLSSDNTREVYNIYLKYGVTDK